MQNYVHQTMKMTPDSVKNECHPLEACLQRNMHRMERGVSLLFLEKRKYHSSPTIIIVVSSAHEDGLHQLPVDIVMQLVIYF